MTTMQLGVQPVDLEVLLTVDADFTANIKRDDAQPWPNGSSLSLVFTLPEAAPVSWQATFNGSLASFDVDKVDVNAVALARPRKVALWFIDGAAESLWAVGKVKVVK